MRVVIGGIALIAVTVRLAVFGITKGTSWVWKGIIGSNQQVHAGNQNHAIHDIEGIKFDTDSESDYDYE